MFNSTHTLIGVSLARAGFDRWTPLAVWTAVIASNLPDIDILTEFHSTASYIAYHRGITHTFVGVTFLSLLLAGVMHQISGRFRRHFVIAWVSMILHPMLDYLNTYGLRPFLPWSSNWAYGDVLFVIDPYLDVILLAGILLGVWSGKKRSLAGAGMLLVVAYVGAQFEFRNMAREKLAAFTLNVANVERSAVSPEPLSPFTRIGFVETPDAISMVEIDVFQGVGRQLARLPKARRTPMLIAAEKTRTGSIFMDFARFPVARVFSGPEGHLVQLIDMRFYRSRDEAAFAAEIRLDRSLKVVSEDMGFNISLNTLP